MLDFGIFLHVPGKQLKGKPFTQATQKLFQTKKSQNFQNIFFPRFVLFIYVKIFENNNFIFSANGLEKVTCELVGILIILSLIQSTYIFFTTLPIQLPAKNFRPYTAEQGGEHQFTQLKGQLDLLRHVECKKHKQFFHFPTRFQQDESNGLVPFFVFGDFNFRCDISGVIKVIITIFYFWIKIKRNIKR